VSHESSLSPLDSARLRLVRCLPFVVALFLACGGEKQPEGPRPNVVLVVIDTLRADHLPFHGYAIDTAPYLSHLAERSVVFENAWSGSSWTPPATASVFTSVYPPQHGVWFGMGTLREKQRDPTIPVHSIPEDLETVPELMRSLGYRTFGITDNPHINDWVGFARGFDRFQNFDYEGAEVVNGVLEEWKDDILGGGPAFVYLHYMDPHVPYHRRHPWYEPREDPELGQHAKKAAAYDSEIRYLDDFLRQAFEWLRLEEEETILILTADHGEEFGDHGKGNHLFQLYGELTHVPLVLHLPGRKGERIRANVSTLDILPTLRAALGAPPSEQDEGMSLLAYLGEDAVEGAGTRPIFSFRLADDSQLQSVVLGDEKFILTKFLANEKIRKRELYDLGEDPDETRSLHTEQAERSAELEALLDRFEAELERWEPLRRMIELDEDERARLEALGYGGS